MIGGIKEQLEKKRDAIEQWFTERFESLGEPLYSSVDIRNSHHKIAVVDTNAFPAGFNNLCPKYCEGLVSSLRSHVSRHYPGVQKILLFPEQHTRNKFYLDNIHRLVAAFTMGGYRVRVGADDPGLREDSVTLEGNDGVVVLHRLRRDGDRVAAKDFRPDLVVVNNDFTSGVPDMLEGLGIPVVPWTGLGWHRRRKYEHFTILNALTEEFAQVMDIDPWRVATCISRTAEVDFNDEKSRGKLAEEVDELLGCIREQYEQRGVDDEPFVFIKHNAGTYGMAQMTARSGDEVRNASRKTRVKMTTGKGRARVSEVLIQEGIPTADRMEGSPMEPVIYMVGQTPVGGFYRLHRGRTDTENLNVRGMEFRRLCFHQVADRRPESLDDRCEDAASLLMVYGTLARLAALALGMEMKKPEKK
jgi:glutamate--cysteine ligase